MRHLRAFVTLTVTVTLFGCVTTTKSLTDEERTLRISRDLEQLFVGQEPVTEAITLAEAKARAIKYNTDYRVKTMEHALAARNIDIAKMELLPQAAVSAGYTKRSNQAGSSSQSLITGEQSLEPSTSQERELHLRDLAVAWNVLDFGVSYVTAKQRQNELQIAEEHRRKAIQNIIQEVTDAYWNAWSSQVLFKDTESLFAETQKAIETSRALLTKGVQRKRDALIYQRRLLEIRSELWDLQERMALARTRLSRLMNLPPGTEYELAAPDIADLGSFTIPVLDLEHAALADRPELREEDYRQRINRLEVRKSILRMFPGIEINAGTHYDSNKFLANSRWSDAGLRLSWNLFNVFNSLAAKKFQRTNIELADTRRMALSMAVLAQVRLALQRYELARERYKNTAELANVNEMFARMTIADTQTQTESDIIQARMTALTSTIRKHLSYAETQNAIARVFNSIGVDPLPNQVEPSEIKSLARIIEQHSQQLLLTHLGPDSVKSPTTPESTPDLIGLDSQQLLTVRPEPEPEITPLSPEFKLDLMIRTNLPASLPSSFREIGSDLPQLDLLVRSSIPLPKPREQPKRKIAAPGEIRNIAKNDPPRWTYYQDNELVAVEILEGDVSVQREALVLNGEHQDHVFH